MASGRDSPFFPRTGTSAALGGVVPLVLPILGWAIHVGRRLERLNVLVESVETLWDHVNDLEASRISREECRELRRASRAGSGAE